MSPLRDLAENQDFGYQKLLCLLFYASEQLNGIDR